MPTPPEEPSVSPDSQFSARVSENAEFLGDRASRLADQEIERARALDTKAGGIVAGSIALIAAGAAFASKIYDTLRAQERRRSGRSRFA
jgi:hypothetical protein